MRLQLCVFKKEHDKPSGSGYCQKLETFLRASDYRDYEVKFTTQFTAPKGKLPYINIDGKPVADSHFIIRYLIREDKVRDLDASLSLAQKAESRAWQAYIEELIYPATVWTRVYTPVNQAALMKEACANVPFILRPLVTLLIPGRIKKGLRAHGVGRHTPEEVDSILEDFISNLVVRLKETEGDFFHGSTPTIIDTIVYGFLVNALATQSNPGYTSLILESRDLREYIARGTRLWFPEYTRTLQMVA